ncbi:MAG: hypothetical protein K2H18_04090, partial [Muribaculaceae bacterium]|nr:hypothetical protein [Muribaculaceae bacterium]
INNYVDKLIQYEFNVLNVDLSYLDKAFVLFGHDHSMYYYFNKYSRNFYSDNFSTLKEILVPESGLYTGTQAVSEMKTDYWGYVDWRVHAHYAGLGTSVINTSSGIEYHGINALDNEKAKFIEEPLNGLDTWANRNHPCWSLSMSCDTSEIGYNRGTYTIADSFVFGKNYGGVCFIGDSGPGYTSESSALTQKILDCLLDCFNSGTDMPYAGTFFNKGEIKSNTDKHVKIVMGITGDPLASIWLRKPYNNSVDGIGFNPEYLNSNSDVNFATYSFNDNKTEMGIGKIAAYSGLVTSVNSTLLNTRADMQPFIHPTTISGLSINEDRYWFTGKLDFISSQNNNAAALCIGSNKTLNIETLGDVNIKGDIVIEKNAILNIKAYKPVIIKDADISSDGYLNFEINSSFEIQSGCELPNGTTITPKKFMQ